MMITNALRASWPGDLVIEDHATAGLLIPSKVRTAKLATIDTAQASPLGRLPPSLWTKVQAALADAVRMQAHP
jgi:mRNA interferase MazF